MEIVYGKNKNLKIAVLCCRQMERDSNQFNNQSDLQMNLQSLLRFLIWMKYPGLRPT